MTEVTWDRAAGGWVAFVGDRKVCVLTTQQHMQNPTPDKLSGPQVAAWKDGLIPWEPLPPESWTVHFCSPAMHLEELKAILGSLPTEA